MSCDRSTEILSFSIIGRSWAGVEVLECFGRFWKGLEGPGKQWKAFGVHGMPWKFVEDIEMPWKALESPGRPG